MRATIFVALAMFSANCFAVDFDDCRDRMERVHKSARDANMSIMSSDDLDTARSVLDDIQDRVEKAKRACGTSPTPGSICQGLRGYAITASKKEAASSCAANFERIWPGFCSACLGQ